ncbi:hypothetical protein ONZ45_g17021 [Pleurotus djamor]|nr:hypothetical protein ONZ45_g17021 [Pleurotus djamor]
MRLNKAVGFKSTIHQNGIVQQQSDLLHRAPQATQLRAPRLHIGLLALQVVTSCAPQAIITFIRLQLSPIHARQAVPISPLSQPHMGVPNLLCAGPNQSHALVILESR